MGKAGTVAAVACTAAANAATSALVRQGVSEIQSWRGTKTCGGRNIYALCPPSALTFFSFVSPDLEASISSAAISATPCYIYIHTYTYILYTLALPPCNNPLSIHCFTFTTHTLFFSILHSSNFLVVDLCDIKVRCVFCMQIYSRQPVCIFSPPFFIYNRCKTFQTLFLFSCFVASNV